MFWLKRNNVLIIVLLCLFIIPALLPLFHSGVFLTDDGNWMIIRFSAFYEVLRHGQFPVRFLMRLNNGYGYPVGDFLYPLFMYLGVPIHILGFGFITTVKIILGGSMLLSGIFCYVWLKKLFTPVASFVGALCYALFPYHIYDVYQRGSVGEVLALCIVPFIFWQIERKKIILIATGIALLILAHNSLALLFLPVILAYLLLEKYTVLKTFVCLLFGLSLSAFFWIPALYDKQFTVFDTTSVSNFSQYFISKNNFNLLGIFSIVIIMISISFALKKYKKDELFFLIVTFIGIFFASSFFAIFWKVLPLPQLIQFPFRFLSLVVLGISFLAAAMVNKMKTSVRILVVVLSICMMTSAWSYLFPKVYQQYPEGYYATNQDTTTIKNEYMPKWVKQIPVTAPHDTVTIVKGNGTISNVVINNANKIQFTTQINRPSTVRINIVYFPGWNVLVNNKKYNFSYNNKQGVMDISLPNGNYSVTAKFGETPIRYMSDIISLLSILFVSILLIKQKYAHT